MKAHSQELRKSLHLLMQDYFWTGEKSLHLLMQDPFWTGEKSLHLVMKDQFQERQEELASWNEGPFSREIRNICILWWRTIRRKGVCCIQLVFSWRATGVKKWKQCHWQGMVTLTMTGWAKLHFCVKTFCESANNFEEQQRIPLQTGKWLHRLQAHGLDAFRQTESPPKSSKHLTVDKTSLLGQQPIKSQDRKCLAMPYPFVLPCGSMINFGRIPGIWWHNKI